MRLCRHARTAYRCRADDGAGAVFPTRERKAMTPQEYLAIIVEPTCQEFFESPLDTRKAILASLVTYHVIDAIAVAEGANNESAVYDRLLRDCPQLRELKGTALAAKHIHPRQNGFSDFRLENVRAGRSAAFSDGSYYSDGTSHSDAHDAAVLMNTSKHVDIEHTVRTVMTFWKRVLS